MNTNSCSLAHSHSSVAKKSGPLLACAFRLHQTPLLSAFVQMLARVFPRQIYCAVPPRNSASPQHLIINALSQRHTAGLAQQRPAAG